MAVRCRRLLAFSAFVALALDAAVGVTSRILSLWAVVLVNV
jgi:hypothetical protein